MRVGVPSIDSLGSTGETVLPVISQCATCARIATCTAMSTPARHRPALELGPFSGFAPDAQSITGSDTFRPPLASLPASPMPQLYHHHPQALARPPRLPRIGRPPILHPMRPHQLVLLALLLLAPAARAQTPPFPDTPAGHAAQAWFAAVRSGDPDQLRHLIENRFDPGFRDRVGVEQHLARHTALASAGLNAPHSVAHATEHDITLFLRDGGVWGELRIAVSPQPPHAIVRLVPVRRGCC